MLEGKDIKEGKEGSGAVRARRRVEDDGAENMEHGSTQGNRIQ